VGARVRHAKEEEKDIKRIKNIFSGSQCQKCHYLFIPFFRRRRQAGQLVHEQVCPDHRKVGKPTRPARRPLPGLHLHPSISMSALKFQDDFVISEFLNKVLFKKIVDRILDLKGTLKNVKVILRNLKLILILLGL
jgi:hypothetical protein